MENYEELVATVLALRSELDKLYAKGNKSAGTRARAVLQEVRRICVGIRQGIQAEKRTIGRKRK